MTPTIIQSPKLVLFDLDDTLCDHDTSLRLRLRLAFKAALDGMPGIDLDEVVEASVQRSIAGTDHFADVLAAFGMTDPERVERAVSLYVSDRYRGLQLFEDTLEVVETIKRYADVGIITNGPSKIQRDKILMLELSDVFPIILISEEVGSWKPDPAIFHRALELGNASPGEAVFVGDSPDHDIAGARAAGLTTIWMNRRGRPWAGGQPADYEIRALRDLLTLFTFRDAQQR